MFNALVVVLVILSVILIGAVLLQSGKGSGLAASFGGASSSSDSIMGTHQLATGLTKWTWYLGALFLFLAYVLFIMSARPSASRSVLDQAVPPAAPAQQRPTNLPTSSAPIVPLLPAPAAPAAPSAPAPSTTPPR